MSVFRVLHLSDIHIGDTYMSSENVAYRLISDIENEGITDIKCVIVTGDIFEGKCKLTDALINEAVNFFNIIIKELQATAHIQKTDFLFIPGNHDIIREKDTLKRWKKYDAFLRAFYGDLPDFYDSGDYTLVKAYEADKIIFAGFNSCGLKEEPLIESSVIKSFDMIGDDCLSNFGLEKDKLLSFLNNQLNDKKFVDFGEIPSHQMLKIQRKLNKFNDYNVIALLHHHFYLFPEVYTKYGDSSLVRNYTNVIQQMQQAGVKTVLHGHKHFDLERPLVTDSYYENANNIINIIAGGSVATNRTTKHTFNVIDFYDKENDLKLVQRKFIYNNDQLEQPITTRHLPPEKNGDTRIVRLYNALKLNNPDLFSKYVEAVDKINIAADDYNNIVKWLENIFVGFDEVQKTFERNSLCALFLLFAMNYRVLKVKQIVGGDKVDISYYTILEDLILKEIDDVGFDKKQYLKLFEQRDLDKLKEKCDLILDSVQNKKSKLYLAFSMVGIFVTDIYLMLRYYAGSFYNKYIKYKVNIKLDEMQFHQDVPVQKIMIRSDADRRSAFIDLQFNSSTAHKLAVLFVKEFELMISMYEDYFKIVGLKLYYLTPKIEKNDTNNTIDNYNFEAYIPTLIPLLTGDNIYAQKAVFARELIQNSIDAIAVRQSQEPDFDDKIYITLGQVQGRKFFKIKDFGTGMDRLKIERYFTSIGRSFYSGDEYRDLELEYKPISNFGIGFLSAFMICREIDVKTRYYIDDMEGLKLHIPNYDGCFFIEKDDNSDIGTEITLYIERKISNNITFGDIVKYICDTMQDINRDIIIVDETNKKQICLKAHNIRKRINNKNILFVPFLESGRISTGIDVEKDIWSGKIENEYSYGVLVNIAEIMEEGYVLNSGIRLSDTDPGDVWSLLFDDEDMENSFLNNFFCFNFPSNYLNIDVSREKITDLDKKVVCKEFKEELVNEIFKQLKQYICLSKDNNTNVRAINLYYLMMRLANLCDKSDSLSKLKQNIMSSRYVPFVQFNETSINLYVGTPDKKPNNAIQYNDNNFNKIKELFFDFLFKNEIIYGVDGLQIKFEQIREVLPRIHDLIRKRGGIWRHRGYEEYYYRYILNNEFDIEVKEILQKVLKTKEDTLAYAFLFIVDLVLDNREERRYISSVDSIFTLLLKNFTVTDIENDKCYVSIASDSFQKVFKRIK